MLSGLDEVRVSDRVAMLFDGAVLEEGTPDEIRLSENPVVRMLVPDEIAITFAPGIQTVTLTQGNTSGVSTPAPCAARARACRSSS